MSLFPCTVKKHFGEQVHSNYTKEELSYIWKRMYFNYHSTKSVPGPSDFEKKERKLGAMDLSTSILNSMHFVSQFCPLERWCKFRKFPTLCSHSTCHATLGVLHPVLVPTIHDRHQQTGKGPKESTKVTEGPENLPSEESLKELPHITLARRNFEETSSQYPRM